MWWGSVPRAVVCGAHALLPLQRFGRLDQHIVIAIPALPPAACCRMSRDQRMADNWALLHACEVAKKNGQPVAVAFNLVRPGPLL